MNKASVAGFVAGLVAFIILAGGYMASRGAFAPTKPGLEISKPVPVRDAAPAEDEPEAVGAEASKPAPPASAPTPPPAPTPAPIPAPDPVATTSTQRMTLSRTLGNNGAYLPGGTVDVTITIANPGDEQIRAMGLQETIPPGWTFDSLVSGDRPDLAPPKGRDSLLEFAWFNIPKYPTTFTYRMNVPAETDGSLEMSGQVIYRTDGPEFQSDIIASPLTKGDAATAPAAAPTAAPENTAAKSDAEKAQVPAGPGLQIGHLFPEGGYTPGAPLQIEVVMNCGPDELITAMAVVEDVPEGWTFLDTSGDAAPVVKPQPNTQGHFEFVWITVPQWPASFIYTVQVPADAKDNQMIKGQAIYRTTGDEEQSPVVVSVVSPK